MSDEIPVSRFWSCLFSTGLVALFWTQKMKKTRKWILALAATYAMNFVIGIIFQGVGHLIFPNGVTEYVGFYSVLIIAMLFLPLAIPIYFMFRWTTDFNTRVFGYSSKKRWKEAGYPDPIPKSDWFRKDTSE